MENFAWFDKHYISESLFLSSYFYFLAAKNNMKKISSEVVLTPV